MSEPLPGPAVSAFIARVQNPARTMVEFAWQVYHEEQARDLASDGRPRLVGDVAPHARERELRVRQLGSAVMRVAPKTGFPVAEVEERVMALEQAVIRALRWDLAHLRPPAEQEMLHGEYLIQCLNHLCNAIDPVRRLADCLDGQIGTEGPTGVHTLGDLLEELERRERTGRNDTADLDQWPGVRGLRSLALAWWRTLLTAASVKRFRFEFCVMVGVCIDQGNHAQLFEVATALLARRNTPPPYIPSASELDSEECLRAQEMARQTFPVPTTQASLGNALGTIDAGPHDENAAMSPAVAQTVLDGRPAERDAQHATADQAAEPAAPAAQEDAKAAAPPGQPAAAAELQTDRPPEPAAEVPPADHPTESASEETDPDQWVETRFGFECDLAVWRIQFEDESGSISDNDFTGLKYIAQLLARPHQAIAADKLYPLLQQAPADAHSVERTFDDEGRTAVEKQALRLKDEIEEARSCGAFGRVTELTEALQRLADAHAKDKTKKGKARRLRQTPLEQAAERIRKAIGAVRAELRKRGMTKLAAHLERIKKETTDFAYRPDKPDPPWHICP